MEILFQSDPKPRIATGAKLIRNNSAFFIWCIQFFTEENRFTFYLNNKGIGSLAPFGGNNMN